jgi:hemerythrin superfamily protein
MTSLNFSEYNVDAPEVLGFEKPRFNKPPKNQTIKKKRNVSNLLKTMNTRPSLEISETTEPDIEDEEETDWNAAYSGKMELPSPPQMQQQESFTSTSEEQPPQYTRQYVPYYATQAYEPAAKDQVMEKMNYMIHLLEEQKDEKSGGVVEELILYGFLGVFMIFMVDSFSKVGHRYTR